MAQLPTDLFDRVVRLLLPFMRTEDDRHTELDPIVHGRPVADAIQWEGSPRQFTVHLVGVLSHADLVSVVRRLAVGEERRQEVVTVSELIEQEAGAPRPDAPVPEPPRPDSSRPQPGPHPPGPPPPIPQTQPPVSKIYAIILTAFGVVLLGILGVIVNDARQPRITLTLEEYEERLAKVRAEVKKEAKPNEADGRELEAKAKSRLEQEFGEISIETTFWPNSTVPYVIAKDFSDAQRVRDAISAYEQHTNIRFVERTNANAGKFSDYVQFVSEPGCWSNVGMAGGMQKLSAGTGCAVGNILHEVGHLLGLYHEHSRPDRDKYVRIVWDNVLAPGIPSFNIVQTAVNMRRPYDYESIMHFPPTAFSANGKPTIEALLPTARIGSREELSAGDILLINSLYPKVGDSR